MEEALIDYGWPSVRPPFLVQLGMWARIGLLSFGGGPAVQTLAYDALVARRRWVSPAGYARLWGMCQVVPGINLVALAVVAGNRIGGIPGIVAAVGGMVLPGSLVIVLITIGFNAVRDSTVTQAALRGGIAGVAGLGLFMAWRLLFPQLKEAGAGGRLMLAGAVLVFAGVVATFLLLPGVPVVIAFLGAGLAMVAIGRTRRRR